MKQEKSLLDLFQETNKGISRRLFLETCGASLVAAALPINLTKVFAADTAASAGHLTLTWSLDPKTTQTIAWSTPDGIEKGSLQIIKTSIYKKDGWAKATSIEADHELFKTNTENVMLHYATAVSLMPGTIYTYRV